uniref:Uncharacterized protein n=1 Tax=Chromera velia CCMP2878 TaxID=1169474 RepID=A0A0G4GUH1_9ALVE|eukprot:Cvel_23433.t1-p1 / transcript=Cvel_23433.t1 / gene=Cvel_23433 / organism=Chromera_velia_CCMP2878 / gene_product=hypothetical protein / transcript_product=hypothetical protein / location=Cvel_scaffold2415:982-1293(-) / protein_length=104 / sequence_SO=supercontig / SO=protein_coding / is_pseudo=false
MESTDLLACTEKQVTLGQRTCWRLQKPGDFGHFPDAQTAHRDKTREVVEAVEKEESLDAQSACDLTERSQLLQVCESAPLDRQVPVDSADALKGRQVAAVPVEG